MQPGQEGIAVIQRALDPDSPLYAKVINTYMQWLTGNSGKTHEAMKALAASVHDLCEARFQEERDVTAKRHMEEVNKLYAQIKDKPAKQAEAEELLEKMKDLLQAYQPGWFENCDCF